MEDKKVQSSFKLMGTILGAIILIAGSITIGYAIINQLLFGLIAMGVIVVAIGALIIYSARRLE